LNNAFQFIGKAYIVSAGRIICFSLRKNIYLTSETEDVVVIWIWI